MKTTIGSKVEDSSCSDALFMTSISWRCLVPTLVKRNRWQGPHFEQSRFAFITLRRQLTGIRGWFSITTILSGALLASFSTAQADWVTDGVPICTAANSQGSPTIVSDDVGGAIITWRDPRSGGDNDVYAQRISASGDVQWTTDGVPICTASNSQGAPKIVSDGAGVRS